MLYNQLLYFARLFDVERILSQAKNSNTFGMFSKNTFLILTRCGLTNIKNSL